MNDSKLLPCPFCGGNAKEERSGRGLLIHVGCESCVVWFGAGSSMREQAVAAWNRRSLTAPDSGEREDGVRVPRGIAQAVAERVGWHGDGEHDRERFYCEECKVDHEDGDKIEHRPWCNLGQFKNLVENALAGERQKKGEGG